MFRFKSSVAIGTLFFGICLVTAGCGSDSGSSAVTPTSPTSAPAPTLSLAGTWTGTFSIPGDQEPVRIRSWTASQSGASVSGPMVLVVDEDQGQEVLVNATLTGTVSGAQLTSATFTVAAGGIPDPGLAICSIRGTGTLAATATSMSGPLAIVIAPASLPCVGPDEGISNTATGTWTFSLTK